MTQARRAVQRTAVVAPTTPTRVGRYRTLNVIADIDTQKVNRVALFARRAARYHVDRGRSSTGSCGQH